MKPIKLALVLLIAAAPLALAQKTGPQKTGPKTDTSVIDADGTAHVTRVVPVPQTISPEAQKMIGQVVSDKENHQTLAERRSEIEAWQVRAADAMKAVYPVTVTNTTIAGVPVRIVMPPRMRADKLNKVLINVHGGGFNSDSGSLTESIPIANLAQIKVVSVLYRLAPEHPFPAAVDDTIAVYQDLLKSYQPQNIGIYGTSAGAILTAEVAVRLKQLKLPLPAALGVFSGMGDFSHTGDSQAMYALAGLSGHLDPPKPGSQHNADYAGTADPKDPVLSPLFADVHGFPPTLFITSERDLLLSGTTILQRHFYESGVESPLIVFEGLPHAFWNNVSLPESNEALRIMAQFFSSHLGKFES